MENTKAVPPDRVIARKLIRTLRTSVFISAFGAITAAFGQPHDVHEEPFHRPIYAHGSFRYLDVFASPGDTTAMHSHRLPILYLCISGSEVWLDEENAKPRHVNLPTGWIGSDMYSDSTVFVHRFAVTGDSDLHIIAVERTTPAGHAIPQFETGPIFSENGFEVYAVYPADSDSVVENLPDSGKNFEWPAVVYQGTVTGPPGAASGVAGKTYGPGALLPPQSGPWRFGDETVLWMVVPARESEREHDKD